MPYYPQIESILERAERVMASREYSPRTRAAYRAWIDEFLRFHRCPYPDDLNRRHAEAFLEYLQAERQLAAKTRNQAASGIAFLYREILGNDAMDAVARPKGRRSVPVVLSVSEVAKVLGELRGRYWLIGALLYGTGMRLNECLNLRVKDLDFDLGQIAVREGKGGSHRLVPLPDHLRGALRRQVSRVERIRRVDRGRGAGWACLPGALHRKDPGAGYTLKWQFLFPASRVGIDPVTKRKGRHHLHATAVQRQVKDAVRAAQILKKATCHSLRHSFATQMLRDGCDIRTVQKLMGHADVRTTMIYLHATDQIGLGVRSPLDRLIGQGRHPGTTQQSPMPDDLDL
jgi:integron integrase